ncbi:LacI family DNA-binding transcriptional regulator [Microbacterium sp. STN6]|uniref:LacI family DNA-binding transcriptional regulator n=1 Tax=Microbacterium sp. STN6 TaxID=2995588 RepID=UPI002260C825|nr:LacI family DNA-binding transcriptional regulator [Microbacterium sp. STN6]MCX7522817.1 LacI family DNA-binding transcriptional regulator [Microbacterium sp. STN6]
MTKKARQADTVNEPSEGAVGRRVTMDKLAELAGVHKSTVSRALRPGTTFYQSPTAQRIRAIADSVDFQPDRYAASLRTRRTGTIGVLVPRLSDNLQAVFYESVVRACTSQDIVALVAVTGDDPVAEQHAANALLGRRVDGLILTSTRVNGEYPAQLAQRDVPYVLALRHNGTDHSCVVSDDRAGGYLVTQHLLELGHRRIGIIAGPDHASTAVGRRQGFMDAHRDAGVSVEPDLVHKSMFRWQDGYDIATKWLSSANPPTAIFAVNDEMAFGVVAAAQTRGLDLPGELSIVGYNDIPSAARPPMPLTTARMDIGALARAAVDSLRARIDGEQTANRTIPVTLVVRKSSAPPSFSAR